MNGDKRHELAEAPDAHGPAEIDLNETASRTTSSGEADAPDSDTEVLRISSWMYLRTIFLIAWSAFRHPFRTTYIDMVSGEAVHIRPGEETWG